MNAELKRTPSAIGETDLRPHISVVEGRRLGVLDPRMIAPAPLTLTEFTSEALQYINENWVDRDKVEKIKRGVEAIDLLPDLDFIRKRRLLALFLGHETEGASVSARFLGLSSEREVERVVVDALENDDVVRSFGVVNYLVRPKVLEVYRRKLADNPHDQIVAEEGLPMSQVDDISRRLTLAKIVTPKHPRNRSQAEELRSFCDIVVSLRESGLTNFEIAERLSVSIDRIRRVTIDLLAIGEIEPIDSISARDRKPDAKKRILFKEKVFELRRKKMKIPEIAQALGVSNSVVETALFRGRRGPMVRQSHEMQKNILKEILNNHLKTNGYTRVSLEKIRRSGKLVISTSNLLKLYLEIAREQEVPPTRVLKSLK